MRPRQLWIVIAFILLLGLVFASYGSSGMPLAGSKRVDMPEFLALVEKGEVAAVSATGATFVGTLRDGSRVTARGPDRSDFILEKLATAGIMPSFRRDDSAWVPMAVSVGLVVLAMALMVGFVTRQMQQGAGRGMSFGKSRAKLNPETNRRATFADVAGCTEAKDELQEIILFLKDPQRFTRLGGRIPKGVLLMGSPGSGKTLLARAVAGEAGVPFFSISGSEFVEMFVGVGASRVRDLFEQAKRQAPCIVFIDEIDAIGRHRSGFPGGGQEERDQTLNQLLVEMDGFEPTETIILVAATNRPDVLDPALLRPGRFDRRVVVPAPDVRGRLGILEVHARRTPLAPEVDLDRIAKGTPGFSGADLENLVNEAALLAAREEKSRVEQVDLERAKDKVAMGAERRSLVQSDEEKRHTAYHEAGHAIVARLVPECDPVSKITIVPRGMSLGLTMMLPEERHSFSERHLRARMAMAMGGRVAEQLVFGELWTGAEQDIRQATRLARGMVCDSGMSTALGPVAWGDRPEGMGFGFEPPRSEVSSRTAAMIDDEVRSLVDAAAARARALLEANRPLLDAVAARLLERESMDGVEFEALASAHLGEGS